MITIPYFGDPIYSDLAVQTIRESLAELTWLQYTYPIAQILEDDNGDTYPAIYLQDDTGEYQSLLPDTSVTAYCFFIDNGYDIGFEGEPNTYRLILYVWASMTNIHASISDFTSRLVGDVVATLRDLECYALTVTIRDPFAEFTAIKPHENASLMRNRTGFRIDFSVLGDSGVCRTVEVRRRHS